MINSSIQITSSIYNKLKKYHSIIVDRKLWLKVFFKVQKVKWGTEGSRKKNLNKVNKPTQMETTYFPQAKSKEEKYDTWVSIVKPQRAASTRGHCFKINNRKYGEGRLLRKFL